MYCYCINNFRIPYLDPRTARTAFKIRTSMVDIRVNFPNKYENLLCTRCKNHDETLSHIVKCYTGSDIEEIENVYSDVNKDIQHITKKVIIALEARDDSL